MGANVGLYSVYAAAKGSNVLAIEPGPENLFALAPNSHLNGLSERLKMYFGPIGDQDGRSVLMKSGTIEPGGAWQRAFDNESNPLLTWGTFFRSLDGLCEELNFWPDYTKIDVDGFKIKLLEGAGQVLDKAKEVLI